MAPAVGLPRVRLGERSEMEDDADAEPDAFEPSEPSSLRSSRELTFDNDADAVDDDAVPNVPSVFICCFCCSNSCILGSFGSAVLKWSHT